MRPALAAAALIACARAPVPPPATHALTDGESTLAWLAWTPDERGGTLQSWTSLGADPRWAYSTTRLDLGADGELSAWTHTGPTCLDARLRPTAGPCAPRTLGWTQTLTATGAELRWQPAAGDPLPAVPLDHPLTALWLPPTARAHLWLDPNDGRLLPVRSDAQHATLPGQSWTYTHGRPTRATLHHGLHLVPAAEAPPAAAHDPNDRLHLPHALQSTHHLRRLALRADDGRELTLDLVLREQIGPQPASSADPSRLPLDRPLPFGDPLPADRPVLRRVEHTVQQLRAAVREQRVLASPDAALTVSEARGDCDDLAATLVAALAAQHIPARRALGWLYRDTPTPGFVRHAWVEVARPDGGWWPADPALGQVPADVLHVPDEAWGPQGPPARFTVLGAW